MIPILAVVFFAACSSAYAEGANELKVLVDDKVIYCAASLKNSDDVFSHALNDGISVATVWDVQVDRARDYWLNKSIAEVTVTHRVVPDLLSRSWLLEDQASGISLRVYSVSEAVRFLSSLEYFPVLDRSLLVSAAPYVMHASVVLYIGEVNETWWGNLLKSEQASMQQEFTLP
nr:DUF4390 domain-containing protein [Mariprofundus aestuarium]